MAEHTKGPWRKVEHSNGDFHIESETDSQTQGVVSGRHIGIVSRFLEASESNASLIAAAPDLLAVCKTARKAIEIEYGSNLAFQLPYWAGLIGELNDVIRKAEGES